MGMFDWVECRYPLPVERHVHLTGYTDWQSKDTPDQQCSQYTIDEQGNLWVRQCGVDQDENAKTVPCDYTGAFNFYTFADEEDFRNEWVEYCATFARGRLVILQHAPDEPIGSEG